MNKKLLALSIISVTLTSVSAVYAFTFVLPPNQTFNGSGIVYAVEYECFTATPSQGNLFAPGLYGTNILIHNNQKKVQFVYIKILDGITKLSLWVPSQTDVNILYRFVIQPDGLLDIDCAEIHDALNSISPGTIIFAKGLIIISQPNGNTPLDVIGSYTIAIYNVAGTDFVGGSKDIVIYSGTKVSNTPTPCVLNAANNCSNLPP